MEDGKLIELLKRKPAKGLHRAIEQYRGLVASIVLRILNGHPQDIEECIADTFVNVWKSVDQLDAARGGLKGYLACTARNTAINRLKKLSREQSIPLEEQELLSPDDQMIGLEKSEDARQLHQAISSLPNPTREILIRRHFYFESLPQIAEATGLTPVQVKNKLYQGKQKLKTLLTERGVLR